MSLMNSGCTNERAVFLIHAHHHPSNAAPHESAALPATPAGDAALPCISIHTHASPSAHRNGEIEDKAKESRRQPAGEVTVRHDTRMHVPRHATNGMSRAGLTRPRKSSRRALLLSPPPVVHHHQKHGPRADPWLLVTHREAQRVAKIPCQLRVVLEDGVGVTAKDEDSVGVTNGWCICRGGCSSGPPGSGWLFAAAPIEYVSLRDHPPRCDVGSPAYNAVGQTPFYLSSEPTPFYLHMYALCATRFVYPSC